MTPAELLALADAPTEQVRFVGHADFMEINAILAALAPDLARLCAEMGEALERELNEETSTHVHVLAEKCVICERLRPLLAKLSELEPK